MLCMVFCILFSELVCFKFVHQSISIKINKNMLDIRDSIDYCSAFIDFLKLASMEMVPHTLLGTKDKLHLAKQTLVLFSCKQIIAKSNND